MIFDERLRKLREKTGLNQTEFATHLGYNQSKYNKWENGNSVPGYETLCELASKLETSTDYLLGRSDVSSANLDTQMIHEITGLSEPSIEMLKYHKKHMDAEISDGLIKATGRERINAINAMVSNRRLVSAIAQYLAAPTGSPEELAYCKIYIVKPEKTFDQLDAAANREYQLPADMWANMLIAVVQEELNRLRDNDRSEEV